MNRQTKKYLAECYRDNRAPHPQDVELLGQIDENVAALDEATPGDRWEMVRWQAERDLERTR